MPPPAAPVPSSPRPGTAHLLPSRRAAQSSSNSNTSQAPASSGSQTVTATNSPSRTPEPELVLHLRGAHNPRPRIQWAEGTVDNEGLGRKKSKVCCIYHKERPVGDSSDESSSSDDSSGDEEGDEVRARTVGGGKKGGDGEGCGHGHGHKHGKARKRKPSPNAYEKMPKYDIKSLQQVDKAGV